LNQALTRYFIFIHYVSKTRNIVFPDGSRKSTTHNPRCI